MNETLAMPRRSGWALPDDALDFICDIIAIHPPALVLEIGSGRSTVALADTLRTLGSGMLVALEHELELAAGYRELLEQNGLDGIAEIRDAPLEQDYYPERSWADLSNVDVLLVDGPPGHLCRSARAPALPLLSRRLSPGALVIADDTNRPDERRMLETWRHWITDPVFVTHSTGEMAYARFRP